MIYPPAKLPWESPPSRWQLGRAQAEKWCWKCIFYHVHGAKWQDGSVLFFFLYKKTDLFFNGDVSGKVTTGVGLVMFSD
jgi:hypothetical protein